MLQRSPSLEQRPLSKQSMMRPQADEWAPLPFSLPTEGSASGSQPAIALNEGVATIYVCCLVYICIKYESFGVLIPCA